MARKLIVAFLLASAVVLSSISSVEAAALNANVNVNTNVDPNVKAHYQTIAKSISDKIKHIIIVMMENRSFDHMFGFYGKGTNGLTGKEYNLVDVSNPNSEKIYVDTKAPFINECDPSHSYPKTMEKLYGNKSHAHACDYKCVNMGGFVHTEGATHQAEHYCNVMQSVNNTHTLPVMTKLAEEFALMDRFFCSIPGPTWPNRLFHLSATSNGDTETSHWFEDVHKRLYPQKTIFDQVNDAGGEWKLYYNDTPWEVFLESVAHNPEHLHKMTNFYEDAAKGTLPDFAFINPLAGSDANLGGNNDHHPDHDLRAGEKYYKDIYEALRAGPKWNETLFIITYDEHGGFHDHVHPPTKVPPPKEGIVSYPDKDFKFDRIGVRIPTLLISPWVPKGLVVGRAPAAQNPKEDSEYDLTSIMASSRKILKKLKDTPALTDRDAWASTFEHVLDMMDTPRTDCPMHLPMAAGSATKAQLEAEGRLPLNDLQVEILTMHHHLANPDDDTQQYPKEVTKQSQVGAAASAAFEKHRARTLRWKASKGRLSQEIMKREGVEQPTVAPLRMFSPAVVAKKDWTVSAAAEVPYVTIHRDSLCFDVSEAVVGATIKVTHCYPSTNPRKNRDELQWWVMTKDATIRPHTAQSLCVTNVPAEGLMVLAECKEGMAAQQFAFDATTGAIASFDGNHVIAH